MGGGQHVGGSLADSKSFFNNPGSMLVQSQMSGLSNPGVIGHPGKSIFWKFYFKNYFQTLTLFGIRK